MSTKRKILFFISGPVPTEAQEQLANELANTKTTVCFRNGLQVSSDDSLEKCDAVAGDVPARYRTPRHKDEVLPPMVEELTLPGLGAPDTSVPDSSAAAAPSAPVASAEAAPTAPSVAELSDSVTVAQLKAALTERGIEFPKAANKAALLALYRKP